jgi:TM2 domain-containing membrane protein YozV
MSEAPRARSKTVATWLAILGGAVGLHRFYLHGLRDAWGWLLIPPSLIGLWGVQRMRTYGADDALASLLVPWLGLTLSATMLEAIVYGLMPRERWQVRHDPKADTRAWPWLDVIGAVAALAIGATVLISTIAFVAQRVYEARADAQSNSQRLRP